MLKILQARLQQYMNHELPDAQAGFRKGRGTRDQIANIPWIIKKAREFQKNIYFCSIDYAKAFDCVDHNKLWKILKEMGKPDHLTCLLRNLYAGQEATAKTGHGTTEGFQIGKGVHQGFILSPCLFNLYAADIMRKSGLFSYWFSYWYKKLFLFSHLVMSDAVTSWTAACQAFLSFTISWSLVKLMTIELVMPSNHLVFCHPLLLLPSIFSSIRVFSNESAVYIRWPKYWSFSPSIEYSGLTSFRIDGLISLQSVNSKNSQKLRVFNNSYTLPICVFQILSW